MRSMICRMPLASSSESTSPRVHSRDGPEVTDTSISDYWNADVDGRTLRDSTDEEARNLRLTAFYDESCVRRIAVRRECRTVCRIGVCQLLQRRGVDQKNPHPGFPHGS